MDIPAEFGQGGSNNGPSKHLIHIQGCLIEPHFRSYFGHYYQIPVLPHSRFNLACMTANDGPAPLFGIPLSVSMHDMRTLLFPSLLRTQVLDHLCLVQFCTIAG